MSKLNFTTLALSMFFLMAMKISHSYSARTLPNANANTNHQNHNNNPKTITFLMRDFFNATKTPSEIISESSATKTATSEIPFSKPLGLFPPKHAALVPQTNTVNLPGLGLAFSPGKSYLHELELGVVTDIEEDIFDPNLGRDTYGSQLLGKARGMYVASSEDGTSHMMALKVQFGDDIDSDNDNDDRDSDELRLFGVKKLELSESQESHIAVIGGVGKYQGANGYATVQSLREKRGLENKLLEFIIYLS